VCAQIIPTLALCCTHPPRGIKTSFGDSVFVSSTLSLGFKLRHRPHMSPFACASHNASSCAAEASRPHALLRQSTSKIPTSLERLQFVIYSPRVTGIQFFQKVSYIPRSLIPSSNNSDLCSKSALRGSAKHAHEPPCLSSCALHASRDRKHQQPPRI